MQPRLARSSLELRDLAPDPREEWQRLLRFVAWGPAQQAAALESVDTLIRSAGSMVAATYDYLAAVPETAAVLGWEDRVDPAVLEERRRLFSVWMARTLSLDTSDEMAVYLFGAGTLHAGLGQRRADVPSEYVVTAIGLVLASFAETIQHAGLPWARGPGSCRAWVDRRRSPRKVLAFFPLIRDEAFECTWDSQTPENSLWEPTIPCICFAAAGEFC